ncbi:MAG TPA: diguanylate cyclase [Woeseiaceae bacterium]|nr:diguanylate cyclase [Woeseiaceae bacterium]
MIESLDLILPMVFGFAAMLYIGLAIHVLNVAPQGESNSISYFLFLNGAIVGGAALSFGAVDPGLFGLGRVLSFFGGGFVPIVFYLIYREYVIGPPRMLLLGALCIVPAVTTMLAITNPLHNFLWNIVESAGGIEIAPGNEAWWFNRVFVPSSYGLFGYAFIALAGRVQTIPRSQRRHVTVLLIGVALPYAVSLADRIVPIGPPAFPVTSFSLTVMLPFFWWATATLKVHEFTPLAYQAVLDHLQDAIVMLDRAGCIVSVNRQAERLLGAPEADLACTRPWQDVPEMWALLTGPSGNGDVTRTLRLQANRWFEVTITPIVGPSGQDQGAVVVCRDVTERKEALRALSDSEHLIRSLIEHSSNGILRFSRDQSDPAHRFRCVFANGAAERFLDTGTLVGMPLQKIVLLDPDELLEAFDQPEREATPISYETALETAEGERWLRIVGEPVGGDFSVTLVDITQRKETENRILADALRDPLTGVLNRRGFEAEATSRLRESAVGAVLYLDLDQFKGINDRFGHQAGDALLKAFGHRLEFCLRPEDVLARLGGDEFAIVLPDVSVEDASHVAQRLVETAGEPYIIQGQEIECTASVGIALMPQDGDELWQLVAVADRAMYGTKARTPAEAEAAVAS